MSDIEKALVWYDGNNDMPYCDLVYKALKEMQKTEWMPCKPGNSVYTVGINNTVYEFIVDSIYMSSKTEWNCWCNKKGDNRRFQFTSNDVNKTVYLTRKNAEQSFQLK